MLRIALVGTRHRFVMLDGRQKRRLLGECRGDANAATPTLWRRTRMTERASVSLGSKTDYGEEANRICPSWVSIRESKIVSIVLLGVSRAS